jgi:filamentous hemagglutinin family protein
MRYLHAGLILPLALGAAIFAVSAEAGIVTDGSLGAATSLAGPNFAINSGLGQTRGGNLFHSFSQFNLNSGERATFSGPASIANIICRVTGGTASSIDGTISSSINGANLYFLNPAGIVFGPNASLDVTGSFHATTADYLKLGPSGRFEAAVSGATNLTTDPPSAFGFLNSNPASIGVNGAFLAVPQGKSISLVSGGIAVTNGNLWAASGTVNLVSVASAGEVLYDGVSVVPQGFSTLGPVSIVENRDPALQPVYAAPGIPVEMQGLRIANVDASGTGGGKIVIRGGSFILSGGSIFNDTYGPDAPKSVDIAVSGDVTISRGAVTGNAAAGTTSGATITISGGALHLTDSVINTDSQNGANGSSITLTAADKLTIDGTSVVSTDANSVGSHAGTVTLSAPDVAILAGARVSSSAPVLGAAGAGSITVNAPRSFTVAGELRSDTFDGTSGTIAIRSGELIIQDNGLVSTALVSNPTTGPRQAGDIAITADTVTLSGNGRIQSNVLFSNSGSAGNITIDATRVSLLDRSSISASIDAVNGTGGVITVRAADALLVSSTPIGQVHEIGSIASNTTAGDAGHINLTSRSITVNNGATISTFGQPGSTGSAGNITISATDALTLDSGFINTQSASSSGGNISISAPGMMQIPHGEVTASATAGSGNGGNVTIDAGYLTLNSGRITAQAEFGNGGNLLLRLSKMFIKSADSLLSASSRFGTQGTVVVQAPNTDVAGALAVQAYDILNLNAFIPRRCLAADESKASTFRLLGSNGLPAAPETALPTIFPR